MISSAFMYLFLAAAVAGGVGMLALRHPIHAAVSLLCTMLCLAAAYAMLGAHLMAAFQVIIYAGAIMVLVVYIIMLLDLGSDDARAFRSVRWFVGIPAATVLVSVLARLAWHRAAGTEPRPGLLSSIGAPVPAALPEGFGTVASIGRELLGRYVVPFEVTSVLLLAGIVGAVYLTGRDSAGLKAQGNAVGQGKGTGDPARAETLPPGDEEVAA